MLTSSFFFPLPPLWRLEYHNQATWESGVASMMQNSKLCIFFCFFLFTLILITASSCSNVGYTRERDTHWHDALVVTAQHPAGHFLHLHDFEVQEGGGGGALLSAVWFLIAVILTLLFIPSSPSPLIFFGFLCSDWLGKLLLNKLITSRPGPERKREREGGRE